SSGVISVTFFGDHLALEPDGRILVGTNSSIARYHPDGTVDTTFGTNGTTSTGFDLSNIGGLVATQSDGRIIFAAATSEQADVLRYNLDGSLDTTFASGGIARIGQTDTPTALNVDTDGRIVVGAGGQLNKSLVLVRLDADGRNVESLG